MQNKAKGFYICSTSTSTIKTAIYWSCKPIKSQFKKTHNHKNELK